MSLRVDSYRSDPYSPPLPFDPSECEGVDDLYGRFWNCETQYEKNGTGPFQDAATRAYGYASLIEKLLRADEGHVMPDGSSIPESDYELAIKLYAEARAKEVWGTGHPYTQEDRECAGWKKIAKEALDNAGATGWESESAGSDEDQEIVFKPRDRADELALRYEHLYG